MAKRVLLSAASPGLAAVDAALADLAIDASGDGTKALYGDGTFKTPGGGGGGSTTITLTADTNIAAGTAVALDTSGNAVQTWGPAPNFAGTVTALAAPAAGGGGTNPPLIIQLSSTSYVVIATTNAGGGSFGGAVVLTVSGTTITVGTPNTDASFAGGAVLGAAKLGSSTFVYLYPDFSNNLIARVGSVSAGVITIGTAQTVQASPYSQSAQFASNIVGLSATSFIITYLVSNQAKWVVGTVSGTTISLGTASAGSLPSGNIGLTAIALSASLVALAYVDGSNNINVTAASVSGTTLTAGSNVALSTGDVASSDINVAAISSSLFVITWASNTVPTSYQAYAVVGSVSGTTTTLGAATAVALSQGFTPLIAVLSASELCFFSPPYQQPSYASLSGTTLSVTRGAHQPLVQGNSQTFTFFSPGLVGVGSSSFLWCDGQNGLYEGTTAGAVSPPVTNLGLLFLALAPIDGSHALCVVADWDNSIKARVVTFEPINSGPIGFAAAAISNGNSGAITFAGNVSGFSGLTTGSYYHVNGDGTLTTTDTGQPGGYALSSSSLLIAPAPGSRAA